jgi:quercetin dioxygenase-like cupin family protein
MLTSLLALVLVSGVAGVQSRDPLLLYPENYRILVENDHVRVLDFKLGKGAREDTHEHPRHVAVFLTDVKIEFTLPDGTKKLREAKAGDVGYSESTAHASHNIGASDAHGILIELKGATTPVPGLIAPVAIDAAARKAAPTPRLAWQGRGAEVTPALALRADARRVRLLAIRPLPIQRPAPGIHAPRSLGNSLTPRGSQTNPTPARFIRA